MRFVNWIGKYSTIHTLNRVSLPIPKANGNITADKESIDHCHEIRTYMSCLAVEQMGGAFPFLDSNLEWSKVVEILLRAHRQHSWMIYCGFYLLLVYDVYETVVSEQIPHSIISYMRNQWGIAKWSWFKIGQNHFGTLWQLHSQTTYVSANFVTMVYQFFVGCMNSNWYFDCQPKKWFTNWIERNNTVCTLKHVFLPIQEANHNSWKQEWARRNKKWR